MGTYDDDDLVGETVAAGGYTLMLWLIVLVVLAVIGLASIQVSRMWSDARVQAEQGSLETQRGMSAQITDRWSSIQQARGDIDDLQAQVDAFPALYGANPSVWPQGKRAELQQLQSLLANRRSAYRQQCADYEAMWMDAWRAETAPAGVPKTCPPLDPAPTPAAP